MSAAKGRLTPRARKWLRRGGIFALVAGLIGVTYYLALPHIVEAYIRSQLDELSASAGREITFDSFELERLNKYSFQGLRVGNPGAHAEGDFLTAERVTVTLDRTRLFAGQVVIRGIEVTSPVVYLRDYPDGTSNYAELWAGIQRTLGMGEPQEDGPEGPSEGTGGSGAAGSRVQRLVANLMGGTLPTLRVSGARLDVSQTSGDNTPPGLSDLNVEVVSAGVGLACDFNVTAEFEAVDIELLARPFRHLELRGSVNPDDELAEVMLGTGEPMEFQNVPGLPEVTARVQEIGFEYPYTFRVRGLEVLESRTRAPVLRAPSVTVSLRELTLRPERFFVSLLEIEGLRVYMELEPNGRTNIDRLLGLPRGLLADLVPADQREPEPELASDSADDEANTPATEPSPWVREMRRRKWWEVAPQTTVLTDFQVELTVLEDGAARVLTLDLPTIRASKRLLNFQMDVSARADLREAGGERIAGVAAEFVYYYMTDHWGLELQLEELDAGHIVSMLPFRNPFELSSGELQGSLTLTEGRPEGALEIEAETTLTHFAFAAENLDDAHLEGIDVSYTLAGQIDDEAHLTLSRGDLVFNEVQAEVLFDITAFDVAQTVSYLLDFKNEERPQASAEHPDPLPWQAFRLQIDMPRQPVMEVYEAIPHALRTRLDGTEMTGEVGWRLDMTAEYSLDERGRLDVEIDRPALADVLDEGVELVSLPLELDVRRLLDPLLEFTFTDGIGETRLLSLGIESPRWVPLDQVSPAMVNSILNTEDQGFFENQGFNWLQFRRVVADLLEDRAFGRGASTIAMQLVKNVFLSRERRVSRKLAEMFLTYWMNRLVPKERILEVYLNVIEFGPGVNGIAEAAEHYFGKLALDLTLSEATFLVSIVPNPRAYHFYYEQGTITDRWWRHMQRYIERLHARDVITLAEYESALEDRPEFYLPADGEPALRPVPVPEPALPPELLLPFLTDTESVHGLDDGPFDPPFEDGDW